jgi:hypothetical protein
VLCVIAVLLAIPIIERQVSYFRMRSSSGSDYSSKHLKKLEADNAALEAEIERHDRLRNQKR